MSKLKGCEGIIVKNRQNLLKIFVMAIIVFITTTMMPAVKAQSFELSSSKQTENELEAIINEFGEENIVFENGIILYIGESIDLLTYFEESDIRRVICNNSIINVDNTLLTAVSEGVTFAIVEIESKYHVLQVYVEENNEYEERASTYNEKSNIRNNYVVFVDAGHGGKDPGAVANGIREKDINLSIALKVRNKLKALGVEVFMNRDKDVFVDYRDTSVMANNTKADAFVSIHNNSIKSSSVSGIESFYNKSIDKPWASLIHNKLIGYTGAKDRALRWNDFTVTVRTKMPAVLVEGGFLTNDQEAIKLKTDSYQEKIASAIVDGAMDYLRDNIKINDLSAYRIFGQTRYETSYEIFNSGWKNSETVVLVTGTDYADALTAAPLAGKYNAPILLVKNDSLQNQEVLKSLLVNKEVKEAIIVGGTSRIPSSVELELEALNINSRRIAGKTRYETSVSVANELGLKNGEIAIAYGLGFADGLSISSVASIKQIPILLTGTNNIPEEVESYLNSNNISKTYVIGSESVVSKEVENKLVNVERLGGLNRYETNANIFNRFKNELNLSDVYLASALDFPDALSSTALAAKSKSFVLLSNTREVNDTIKSILNNNNNRNKINNVYVLGGKSVIADSILYNLSITEIK